MGPGAGAGQQWVDATQASPSSPAALPEPWQKLMVILERLCLPTRAKTQLCCGHLQALWLQGMGPGPRASLQCGFCDQWEQVHPTTSPTSVSANNPLPTTLFYYFTAQFFLKFYGISLEPPEGDTAPFPEAK